MARNELYSVRPLRQGQDGWRVTKVDRDFNVTGGYTVGPSTRTCDCFAGNKETCRHRQMVEKYLNPSVVTLIVDDKKEEVTKTSKQFWDEGWWFDFDKNRWIMGPTQEA